MAANLQGMEEDRALHYSDQAGHSAIIADITVNLSGIPHQEHCLTCHPQGRAANLSARRRSSKSTLILLPIRFMLWAAPVAIMGEGMPGIWLYPMGPGNGARQVSRPARIFKQAVTAAMS